MYKHLNVLLSSVHMHWKHLSHMNSLVFELHYNRGQNSEWSKRDIFNPEMFAAMHLWWFFLSAHRSGRSLSLSLSVLSHSSTLETQLIQQRQQSWCECVLVYQTLYLEETSSSWGWMPMLLSVCKAHDLNLNWDALRAAVKLSSICHLERHESWHEICPGWKKEKEKTDQVNISRSWSTTTNGNFGGESAVDRHV